MDGQSSQNPNSDVEIKPHSLHRPLSSPEFFDSVLNNSGVAPKKPKLRQKFSKLQYGLFLLAVICFGLGGYLAYQGINSVRLTHLEASSLMTLASKSDGSSLGSSTSVSEAKISASTLASYTVAPSLPRYLLIPKLNVDARVLSVGVTTNGEVGTPADIYDTAWYNESAEPGQAGAMLIDGHVSGWTAKGVFYNIKNLVPGDTISVQRGDNTIFTYKVIRTQIYPYNKVDMTAAMTPVVPGHPGLNLITCAGDVMPHTSEYSQRVIVFTEQI